MKMQKIRWGIISTASIGTEQVIPAMQQSQHCEITAIASRSLEKATSAAKRLGIPTAYGSYDELLQDTNVDAVYIPVPNHLHIPLSLQALKARKHVLCEKPIALNSAEGQQLVEATGMHPELKVMEAFMYRHHPQWLRTKQIIEEGGIGQLLTIQSFFSYFDDDGTNIGNQADLGGGGLMDIGCYNISLSRYLFGRQPKRVMGLVEYDPRFQVDRLASGMMDFGDGTSTFTCSTQMTEYQRVNVFGTTGRIEIEIPFNAPSNTACKMWHERGEKIEEILLPACDQYTIQGDLMSLAIINDTPVPTPIEDSVENMLVIEALKKSNETGRWQSL